MDPSIRLLLERVLEAIIDGGYSPAEFVNSYTGVFASSSALEIERAVYFEEVSHFCDSMTG